MSLDINQLHHHMIYPVVRVRTAKAGGSGTIIYSKMHDDEGITFVLTNFHVVEDAISFDDKWDGLAGRDVKTEIRAPVNVELFKYRHMSWEEGVHTVQADIVAWDATFDLALLQLRSSEVQPFVGNLYPRDLVKDLRIGMETLTVGCSLGHKPIPSQVGLITSLDESIENQRWWMTSSPGIFGNSGGACFHVGRLELLGIPSRIAVTIIGWGGSAVTWLCYLIPVTRIYGWLEEMCYDFIFDTGKTYDGCRKLREEKADDLREAWETRFRRERNIAQGGTGVSPDSTIFPE